MRNPEQCDVYRTDYSSDAKLKELIEADRKIIEKYSKNDGAFKNDSYLEYLANSDYKGDKEKTFTPVLQDRTPTYSNGSPLRDRSGGGVNKYS